MDDPTNSPDSSANRRDSLGRMLLKAIPDLLMRVGRDGSYREFYNANNDRFLWGDNLPERQSLSDIFPQQLLADTIQKNANRLEQGEPLSTEYSINVGGAKRWLEARFVGLDSNDLIVVVRDVTPRKRAELLRDGQNRVLRELALGHSLDDVLHEIALSAADVLDDAICSILTLDESGEHLHHGAGPGLPQTFIDAVDGVRIGPNVGSCGTAAFEKRQVIVEDIENDPLWANYADLALQHGLRACWSTPILRPKGDVLGTFAIYHKEVRRPDQSELDLIDEMSNVAAIAIDHKQHEMSLEISYERFRTIVRNSPVAIIEIDVDGRIIGINATGAKAFGANRENARDIVGTPLIDFVCEDDQQNVASLIEDAFDNLESRFNFSIREDLDSRSFLSSFCSFRDEDGLINKVLCIAADITDQKRNEQELRDHQWLLNKAQQIAQVGSWEWNFHSGTLTGSDEMYRISGLDPETYDGTFDMILANAIHPSDRDAIFESAQQTLASGVSNDPTEFRIIRPDNTIRHVMSVSEVIQDENDRPVRLVGTCQDITERKRHEQQLEEQLRFEKLISSVSADFIRLPVDQIDAGIERALESVAEFLRVERGLIFRFNADYSKMHCTHEWSHGELANSKHRLQNIDCKNYPWIINQYLSGEPFGVPDVERIPAMGANEQRELIENGVKSLAAVSLGVGDQTLGVVCFDCLSEQRDWSVEVIARLKLVGEIIANALGRLQSDEDLRSSEQRYRNLFEGSIQGVLIHRDQKPLLANEAWCQMLGYSTDEIMGMDSILPLIAEPHRTELAERYRAHVRGELQPERYEFCCQHKSGREVWIENYVHVIEWEGEIAVQVTAIDITDERSAQLKLRQSEKQLREVLQNVPAFILTLDLDASVIYINRTQVGIDKQDVLGECVYDFIHPDDTQKTRDAIETVLKEQRGVHIEHRAAGPNRNIAWYSTRYGPIEKDGRLVAISAMSTDITELKTAEQELQERERRFRDLFDNSADAIFVEDYSGNVLDANPSACRLHEMTRSQLIGKNVYELVPPDAHNAVEENFKKLIEGEIGQIEGFSRTNDGRDVPVELKVSHIQYDGNPALLMHVRDISERRKAEAALRENEQRFRMLAESVKLIPWVADARTWNFTYVGPQAKSILGYELNRWYDADFWVETIHPSDQEWVPEFCQQKSCESDDYEFEYRMMSASGEVIWIHDIVQVERDEEGPVRLRGFMIDVTKRKSAEEALRESETRLSLSTEQLPAVMWTTDRNQRVTSCMGAGLRAVHMSPDKVVGKTVSETMAGDSAASLSEDVHLRAINGESVDYEVEFGGRIFEAYLEPLRDARSEIVGSIGMALDITTRSRAEAALRESEERFRQMAESIYEVFWLADWQEKELLYVSPAYEEIWGQPSQTVYDDMMCWLDDVHPDDRERVEDAFVNYQGSDPLSLYFRIVHPNGNIRYVHDRMFPITDISGETYRVAGVMADVTERVEMESELRKRDAELAHVSRLTTMGELAAELAHEINQPLYAISNYASACQSVVSGEVADPTKEMLHWTRQIAEQANRAGGIIRRMNRFLRKAEPEIELTDLNQLIRETLELIDIERRSNNIRVELDLSPALPTLMVDAVLMQQVMVNLTRNAIEAMSLVEDRERVLAIRSRLNDDQTINIDVSDCGEGIEQETADQLFNPFYSTKDSGLGMGLTICRSAVESHQGKLWLTENSDWGTTFHIRLPIDTSSQHLPRISTMSS